MIRVKKDIWLIITRIHIPFYYSSGTESLFFVKGKDTLAEEATPSHFLTPLVNKVLLSMSSKFIQFS